MAVTGGVRTGSWRQQGRIATLGGIPAAGRGKLGALAFASTLLTMLGAVVLLLLQISACEH